jgi:putative endonuclease
MYRQHRVGKEGEELARTFLERRGFEILVNNWRYGALELDIIAHKDEVLHVVEVKTLRQQSAGLPEESVNRAKFQHLQRAAEAFMQLYPRWTQLQFDIVAVTIEPQGGQEILLIEDVYY